MDYLAHVVIIPNKPYRIDDDPDFELRRSWCTEHAGVNGWLQGIERDTGHMIDEYWSFRDPNIALLFKLTWGGM